MCVAHPELVRNARECSEPSRILCPICEASNLVLVTYVFGPRLPAMLAHTVREEIFGEHDDVDAGPLAGLGALPRSRRCALFVQCMRDVVFPGLALHGIDTTAAQAWLVERLG